MKLYPDVLGIGSSYYIQKRNDMRQHLTSVREETFPGLVTISDCPVRRARSNTVPTRAISSTTAATYRDSPANGLTSCHRGDQADLLCVSMS